MKTIIFAAMAIFATAPAAAQTMPLIIQHGSGDRITVVAITSAERAMEIAIEDACEKPFLRDLKGQELYAECLTEARQQAEAILSANEAAGTQLAAR